MAPQILSAFCPMRVKTIPEIWDIHVLRPSTKPQYGNHRSFTSILLIHIWASFHNMWQFTARFTGNNMNIAPRPRLQKV